MSGFISNTNRTFLSVMNGKIVRRSKEGAEHAVSRVNKKGDTVWELPYDAVKGMITGIKTKEVSGFGKMWSILIDVEGSDALDVIPCELSLGYTGNPANCFVCCIENVDLSRPVTFTAKVNTFQVNGEDIQTTSLFLNQDGKATKWAHTKDNPNGMPDKEKVIFKGKEQWDNTKRMEWFEELIKTKIGTKLNVDPEPKEVVHMDIDPNPDQDSLPF
jgi:hypothetical protein